MWEKQRQRQTDRGQRERVRWLESGTGKIEKQVERQTDRQVEGK